MEKLPVVPEECATLKGVCSSSNAIHSLIDWQPAASTSDRSCVVSLSSHKVSWSNRFPVNQRRGIGLKNGMLKHQRDDIEYFLNAVGIHPLLVSKFFKVGDSVSQHAKPPFQRLQLHFADFFNWHPIACRYKSPQKTQRGPTPSELRGCSVPFRKFLRL